MAFTSVTLLKRVTRENPPLQKELQELQYSHFEKRKLHFCFALKKQVICTKNQRANSQPWKIPKHQHQLSFWNLPTCKSKLVEFCLIDCMPDSCCLQGLECKWFACQASTGPACWAGPDDLPDICKMAFALPKIGSCTVQKFATKCSAFH